MSFAAHAYRKYGLFFSLLEVELPIEDRFTSFLAKGIITPSHAAQKVFTNDQQALGILYTFPLPQDSIHSNK